MVTLDMLTAAQIAEIRAHVNALLAVDEPIVNADDRECLLGLDQRLERASRQRAFHDELQAGREQNTESTQ